MHLLIDLNGMYSRGARPQLLAARPAPLQAAHLGYGGSTGAPFVDYARAWVDKHTGMAARARIAFSERSSRPRASQQTEPSEAARGARLQPQALADRLAAPPGPATSRWFSEKLLLLPPSHLPSGHAALFPHLRHAASRTCCDTATAHVVSGGVGGGARAHAGSAGGDGEAALRTWCRREGRARFGLPPPPSRALARQGRGGAVLAYFGQHLKVDEPTFARWMAVLRRAPRAVLWLVKRRRGSRGSFF